MSCLLLSRWSQRKDITVSSPEGEGQTTKKREDKDGDAKSQRQRWGSSRNLSGNPPELMVRWTRLCAAC
jgi:hypothetical protein